MNVLSLFDGMSCGQIALNRAGIKYDKYYASELDQAAIRVARKNYSNTIHLGDVRYVRGEHFMSGIDLLIGGSPCQGFSFAGKQLNFNDPRSKLFFEFVRLLEEIRKVNPSVKFLLENVRMAKESEEIITRYLGVEPLKINSSLVSAQSRPRIYWTNIQGVEIPEDKGVTLKDILLPLEIVPKKYFHLKRPTGNAEQVKILVIPEATKKGFVEVNDGECVDLTFPQSKTRRGRLMLKKANCLTATTFHYAKFEKGTLRSFTPIECERLQTVPDGYTSCVSDSQAYKMLGNGWTIDVIAHILSYLLK